MKPMTPGVSRAARVRAYLAGIVITAGLGGVAMHAWSLQVDDGARFRALADRQHALRLEISAPRGEVVDARGRPLAVSADAESIWANPHDVHDVATTADKLAAIVGAEPSVLEAKLAGDHKFVWIDRHVSPEIAQRVRDAKLPGIEVAHEPRRWYPARTIASTVIGSADIDGNGLDGIELAMNAMLTGRRGAIEALRDARGRTMLADGLAEAEPGATVHLSLDRSIQQIAEAALETTVTDNKAKSGVAVVIEVATGRVLAMASYPTYDPNTGEGHGARNKPVTDAFEAGSVMKVFSVATALDAGIVKPDTEFEIGEQLVVGGRSIHDTHFAKYLTTAGIIKHSSNIGAAKIALKLGSGKLYDGYRLFGFGAKTGIELPGEQVGMLRDGAHWRDIDLAHIAFGYGLTVTPLQISAAMAAIGNHGIYHAPRIVDEVDDGDGTVLYRPESPEHRVIAEHTADAMRTMLASVFDKGKDAGTAFSVDVPGFRCGGKTGTAYKFDTAEKHYTTDHYLASFAGLAPIDQPRLAIVVMIDDPSAGDHYGGQVAAPAFAAIASETLRYLGVPGDPLPSPAGAPAAVPLPAPAPVAELAPDLLPGIPDFGGMGLARALDLARENHLQVEVEGSGVVVAQEPGPGAAPGARVRLHFSDER
jgi:cell division protein FtsI (penicillin-binding protein 3)